MIAMGVNTVRRRELLGLHVGDSESEGSWQTFIGLPHSRKAVISREPKSSGLNLRSLPGVNYVGAPAYLIVAAHETAKAHIRAKGEHPFRVIKQQFGFQKTRLRGMLKNSCKVNVLAALSNLFMERRRLLCSS